MTTFVLLALILLLGISLIPVCLLRRKEYSRAREYFVASEHTPPGVVQSSSVAYALRLATFGQFFSWGASGDFWPAIVFSAMFGAGLFLMYRLRRPMFAFLNRALVCDRSITVPAFIARQHGDDARVQVFAATLTVFALMGLVSSEAIGVASLLQPILPSSSNATFSAAGGLLLLMALYTIPAGNSGVMRSTQAQLGFLYLGLFGSTVLLLYLMISSFGQIPPHGTFAVIGLATCCALVLIFRRSRYVDISRIGMTVSGESEDGDSETPSARLFRRSAKIVNNFIAIMAATVLGLALLQLYAEGFPGIVTQSVAALQAGTRTSIPGLIGLVLLPLFYPIVDTTNWLRMAALKTDSDSACDPRTPATFARILGIYAGASALVWLLMCMFGTVGALATATPGGSDILLSFFRQLALQQNEAADAALCFLLVTLIAMAVSTMSAMFSASLAAIRYDIVPVIWPNLASERAQPSGQALARRHAVVAGCGLCLAMLVVLFKVIDNPEVSFTSGWFLALQLACVCAQLAFIPLVLSPLIAGTRGRSAAVSPAWAMAVLAVGVAAGQGAVIVCLRTAHEAWLWAAVPACLGSGLSLTPQWTMQSTSKTSALINAKNSSSG